MLKLFIRFSFSIFCFAVLCPTISAQQILVSDVRGTYSNFKPESCSFDPVQGQQILPTDVISQPRVMTYSPNGKLYITAGSILATYDYKTGIQTIVHDFGGAYQFNEITCDSAGLIYIESLGSELFTFDTNSGTAKSLGQIIANPVAGNIVGNFIFHGGDIYNTYGNSIVKLNIADPGNSKVIATLNTQSTNFSGIYDFYTCNQKKTYVVATNTTDTFPISNIYEFNWTDNSFKKICSPSIKIFRSAAQFGFKPQIQVDTTYANIPTCDESKLKTKDTQKSTNLLGCDTYVINSYYLKNDTLRYYNLDCKNVFKPYLDTIRQQITSNCKRIVINSYRPAPRINDSTYRIIHFCEGDSTFVNNTWVKKTTIYQNLFRNIYGCDSVDFLKITVVLPNTKITENKTICGGDTIRYDKQIITKSGLYQKPFLNKTACDTAFFLNLKVLPTDTNYINRLTCKLANIGNTIIKSKNSLGCSTYTVINRQLWQNPDLVVHVPLVFNVHVGDSIVLKPILNFLPEKVIWQDSLLFSCYTCLNTVMKPQQSVTIHFFASDSGACTVETDIKVFVDPLRHIYIPTAFSPNGDGNNDVFTIFGDNQLQSVLTMKIFDRWGNTVFSQDDLPNLAGWDGRFQGALLSPDIYIYFVRVLFSDGKIEDYKGDLVLLKE